MADSQSTSALVTYKPVPGFPCHRVGDDGSVWKYLSGSVAYPRPGRPKGRWQRLKGKRTRHGYLQIPLSKDGERRMPFAHHIVLEAFVGQRPSGMVCCHFDGDKLNNRLSNLRWDTYKGNSADMDRHGRQPRGESIPWSYLTADVVREIRRLHADGWSIKRISCHFSVPAPNVSAVVRRKSWRHV